MPLSARTRRTLPFLLTVLVTILLIHPAAASALVLTVMVAPPTEGKQRICKLHVNGVQTLWHRDLHLALLSILIV